MKRLIVVLAALLALPLMGVPSFAQTYNQTPATTQAPKAVKAHPAKMHSVTGEVVSADATAKTMVVKETVGKAKKTMNVTFAVADPATSTLSQLKAGDHVKVGYTMTHGKRTAESITKTENKT